MTVISPIYTSKGPNSEDKTSSGTCLFVEEIMLCNDGSASAAIFLAASVVSCLNRGMAAAHLSRTVLTIARLAATFRVQK